MMEGITIIVLEEILMANGLTVLMMWFLLFCRRKNRESLHVGLSLIHISSLEKIKVYARGWLNYYGIASMKNNIDDINGWLYHRIRMCIWKQWKKPKTKVRNLIKMGVPKDLAIQAGNTRRGHWLATHTVAAVSYTHLHKAYYR